MKGEGTEQPLEQFSLPRADVRVLLLREMYCPRRSIIIHKAARRASVDLSFRLSDCIGTKRQDFVDNGVCKEGWGFTTRLNGDHQYHMCLLHTWSCLSSGETDIAFYFVQRYAVRTQAEEQSVRK